MSGDPKLRLKKRVKFEGIFKVPRVFFKGYAFMQFWA